MRILSRVTMGLFAASLATASCGDDSSPPPSPVELSSDAARVQIETNPFVLRILDADGQVVLETYPTTPDDEDPYGSPAATIDRFTTLPQLLPGWDGYEANEDPWRHGVTASVRESTADHAIVDFLSDEVFLSLEVSIDGPRVRLRLTAAEHVGGDGVGGGADGDIALNKTTLAFRSPSDEHFFGLGERFTRVDHRGLSIYSYAEEGGLGEGEDVPAGPENPAPNGPSMTYFPVPFFISNKGYGFHLDSTFRSELHFDSEADDGWRAAVTARSFDAIVYVGRDPLEVLDAYTADTGRPTLPAPWVFGPRRRVGSGSMVNGVEEYRLMREQHIPVTGMDDAVHFLPALSQLGREAELAAWTASAHDLGYKVMAYNNPYVAANHENATADYAFGKEHGYFVLGPDGEPSLTYFISGQLLQLAAIDLTNPAAVSWFQDLLRRTLDLGYDGWMHDFGEYTARDAVFFDGRRGDEMHNLFPVLSAKAAHDVMEEERPGDYLFFVRSGYSGTQAFVPAVWGGDAEATFDETQGLPASLRAGLNLSMAGVPYWGSDMTGFKCLTDAPNDKEVFLRWVEFGAVSPIMMEQNACTNPLGDPKTKWNLWNDQETIDHYKKYAGLHTRLLPYFLVLRDTAAATGRPITMHPFLLHPDDPDATTVDDAYYLGPALYVSPVVRRGVTAKDVWLPPDATYVDLDDYSVYEGGTRPSIAAPLGKLPLFLVSDRLLPLLDPSIETLAPATDPSVVTLDSVSDRLDVVVALHPGATATLTLDDGTELTATRGSDQGNPDALATVTDSEIADCESCFVETSPGDVEEVRVNGALAADSTVTLGELTLEAHGPAVRRVRWNVLRLP
ncbi:MAG: glycoside hydrolase family 31 protein [Polyangiaceae bacterium]